MAWENANKSTKPLKGRFRWYGATPYGEFAVRLSVRLFHFHEYGIGTAFGIRNRTKSNFKNLDFKTPPKKSPTQKPRLKKLILFDPHPILPPADVFQDTENDRSISKTDTSKSSGRYLSVIPSVCNNGPSLRISEDGIWDDKLGSNPDPHSKDATERDELCGGLCR
ncbi:hypothetical protein PoB_005958200 [Plakobranchus ocellatus]|uniref:Uncharacterized protein n=1 Tax=Plakobranchus ocellatus TaxID=259542 RepID=A0AAV4CMW9_9GAST|nr:hypothetical protein PoB_005958200 [Plakobranchus ocellatus]